MDENPQENQSFDSSQNQTAQPIETQHSPHTTELSSVSDLFKGAWLNYKTHFKTYIGIMLVPALVLIAVALILGATAALTGTEAENFSPIFIIIAAIVGILAFIVQIWQQIALVTAVKNTTANIPVSIKQSYVSSKHLILSGLWIGILSAIIITTGFLLLIIPGVIFMIWYSFALYILIAEEKKGIDALNQSRAYVKGRWGSVFMRVFTIIVLSLLVNITPNVILSVLQVPEGIANIISSIITLLWTPITILFLYLLYQSLKATFSPDTTSGQASHDNTAKIIAIVGTILILVISIIALLTRG